MNNYSTTTYLSNIIDEFFNTTHTITTNGTGSSGYYYPTTSDFPIIKYDNWNDILTDFNFTTKIQPPKYPKTSHYIAEDGTCILEIATTGFSKDEIKIKREGEKIIVSTVEKESKEEKKKFKQVWNDISKRKFELFFVFNDKMDMDKIEIEMENGILKISVPVKEDQKPVVKELEIK